ncbi:MAG: hypothetical protein WDO70_11165 [Alphaproteobacteria bacterium]
MPKTYEKLELDTLLNICLVPDEEAPPTLSFRRAAIKLSRRLNQRAPSYYELSEIPGNDMRLSLPHCTLMHVRVAQETVREVQYQLTHLVGTTFPIETRGIASLSCVPKFDSAALLSRGKSHGMNRDELHHMDWIEVRAKTPLLRLQERIVNSLAGVVPPEDFLTRRGDDYMPHIAVRIDHDTSEMARRILVVDRSDIPQNQVVACRVAIGNCGPQGQVGRLLKPVLAA